MAALKDKLRSQNRKLKEEVAALTEALTTQHELSGLTINHELRIIQSIAMAHGIMATLADVKKNLESSIDIETDANFLAIQNTAQLRMTQCIQSLRNCGLTLEQINTRIKEGH